MTTNGLGGGTLSLKPPSNLIRQATVATITVTCRQLPENISPRYYFLDNKSLLRFQFIYGKQSQAFFKGRFIGGRSRIYAQHRW